MLTKRKEYGSRYKENIYMNSTWVGVVRDLIKNGEPVVSRNFKCLELVNHTIVTDLEYPVLTVAARNVGYRFMMQEAIWMIQGRNDVFHRNMEKFSDDGVTLAGAYGPKIVSQLEYVVDTLYKDLGTRQAVLTIWERNPKPSKDIPCTILMQFMCRNDFLDMHVYMRSSDIWLGVPYDTFSFSCVAMKVLKMLNDRLLIPVKPGYLYNTATSRHLYESDLPAAERFIDSGYGCMVTVDHGDHMSSKIFGHVKDMIERGEI